MPDTPLATVAQLGAYLKQTIADDDVSALLMLSIATGMVRDYLQRGLSYSLDTVLLDNVNGSLTLPDLPVSSVSLVETFDGSVWEASDAANYNVSLRLGIVYLAPNCGIGWPTGPETYRVTYTHGYTEVPMSIIGVILGVAARAWSSAAAAGVDSERIGSYQVKYSMEAEGFTPLETKALAAYLNPRVA